jgi:hypothetical protein
VREAAALLIGAGTVHAQRATVTSSSGPAIIHSTVTASIPGVFAAIPAAIAVAQDDACAPGACFDATVTVRANDKWLLQVSLATAATDFTVTWVESRSPIVAHQLTGGAYQTVASGSAATLGQNVALSFNANTTTGKGGLTPTVAQLAAVLSYRVIAAP